MKGQAWLWIRWNGSSLDVLYVKDALPNATWNIGGQSRTWVRACDSNPEMYERLPYPRILAGYTAGRSVLQTPAPTTARLDSCSRAADTRFA